MFEIENFDKIVYKAAQHFAWSRKRKVYSDFPDVTAEIILPNSHVFISIDDFFTTQTKIAPRSSLTYENIIDIDSILGCILPGYRATRKFPDSLPLLKREPYFSPDNMYESVYNSFLIIQQYLIPVLNGDFSWMPVYREFYRNTNRIQSKLNTVFVFDHPIYMKLINNDPSWETDLNKL